MSVFIKKNENVKIYMLKKKKKEKGFPFVAPNLTTPALNYCVWNLHESLLNV